MKTKSLTISILLLFLSVSFVSAQEDTMKDKLNKIKGDATKIVISTDEGDVTFEGDDAKKLLNKIKSIKIERKMHWSSDDDIDIDGENVMIFKSEDGEKHIIKHKGHGKKMMMFLDDDHNMGDKKTIKVNVETENGEKTITVTTNENGEEKVETYNGKKADEYIEKMNEKGEILIEIDEGADSDSKNVWVSKIIKDSKNIEKNVEVKIVNDVKTVTVTTNENGEENVETFTGEEADKYLEKMESEDKMKDGKKHKKIIIKEIKEEEKK